MIPTWELLTQSGQLRIKTIDEMVAKKLRLTKEQLAILHKNGPRTSFHYKMCWARTYLKQAGISTNPKKGTWQNTFLGNSVSQLSIDWIKEEVKSYQLKKNSRRVFSLGNEYRDTGSGKKNEDQLLRWINIDGSGITNAGGIRSLRSLRSGTTSIDVLILFSSEEPAEFQKPWIDKFEKNTNKLIYWGDARFHENKEFMDFKGNRLLKDAFELNIPILHFHRKRKGYVEFTGIYILRQLEEMDTHYREHTVRNLCAKLERTDDKSIDTGWLRSWRTEDQWELRTKDGPSHWIDYHTNATQFPQSTGAETIVANVPSSFVHKKNKLAEDRGNGEAKLYIGPIKNHAEFDLFFHNWHPMNTYEIDIVETLLYLQDLEDEFSKQSKYKAVSRRLYSELFNKVENLDENRIDLVSHQDKSRYYIRGSNNVWKLIREICLPLITSITVSKTTTHEDGSADFVIKISRSDEVRKMNPTSGQQISQKKDKKERQKASKNDAPRVPDDELKDRVWRRDQGMCQANWRIDSSFDKNSGDICGSNENLEFDHIVPYSKGGKTTYRNLQLLCQRHNRMKSNRDL